jgi:hypothetical protein
MDNIKALIHQIECKIRNIKNEMTHDRIELDAKNQERNKQVTDLEIIVNTLKTESEDE